MKPYTNNKDINHSKRTKESSNRKRPLIDYPEGYDKTVLRPLDYRLMLLHKLKDKMERKNTNQLMTDMESSKVMKMQLDNEKLSVLLPGTQDWRPASVIIENDNRPEPHFAIRTDCDGNVLCRFSLIDPLYDPDESQCQFILDLDGLTALNEYMYDNFDRLVDEWNWTHPINPIPMDQPIPNYRFLGSYAYKIRKP